MMLRLLGARRLSGALKPELLHRVEAMGARLAQLEHDAAHQPFDARRMRELSRLAELTAAHESLEAKAKEAQQLEELAADDAADAELRALARDELGDALAAVSARREALLSLLVPAEPLDNADALLEVRAGAGGMEAGLFAAELFEMYARLARRRGWELEEHERSEFTAGGGGVREAIAVLRGDGVHRALRGESGVHRVQRVPATESLGRVHTSTATVVVLPVREDVKVEMDEADVIVETYRSSGAGGQHVNTTDSAVRLTHKPTGIKVACQDERSQHQNKATAFRRLEQRIAAMQADQQQQEQQALRSSQSGTGARSERIRTYNFHDDRVTDHRLGLSRFGMPRMLEGDLLDEFILALVEREDGERLARFMDTLADG
ncbi:hypothetical protein AB1Y20_006358 [Prymnesium parvum]|uniref:Prokaryotic-type class I peptide chain release factors domain-containing protein n=1 Tax=Prymnesium parvum TaxID=97485 RepID=A0AB34J2H5_PRYPA